MLGFGSTAPFDKLLLISNRMQNHGRQFRPDPYAPYDGVIANLGITWGNDATNPSTKNSPGQFIPGAGRNPLIDGDKTVNYTDLMGEAVWAHWITTHNIIPPTDISTLVATQPAVNQNKLAWTASAGATSYNIYRATDTPFFSTSSLLGTSAVTNYTNSGLTALKTYAYWVQAVDAAGNVSNLSNKVTGTAN